MYRAANNSAKNAFSRHTRTSFRIFEILLIVLLISGVPLTSSAQSTVEEYQVKAAFLFHFAQLTEWPGDALNAGDSSLRVCVFDDEPHRGELQSTIEGKAIGARIFHLRLISHPQESKSCNILFLSRDEARRQSITLKNLRGTPVLTVGETTDFLTEGGIIRFHLREGRIRFDINLEAAESCHLKISSRLLLLATSVTRGGVVDRGR